MRARRLIALGVLGAVVLSACSGGDSVPDDQPLKPLETPEGWIEQEIAGVTFATPSEWEELELPDPAQGTARIGFADEPSSSGSTGGIIVMVLPEARFPAKTQTQTFVTSAKNQEEASGDEMSELVWPGAEVAWYAAYTAQVGTDETVPHPTAHLVLDLENGYQVQATVRAEEGSSAAKHLHDALATLRVSDDVEISEVA
ncbi:hypothetical protein [uncultured Aeromicrobium sp.]|uniref:hypothetical protein n=1 Tax=uncultured Aeromicrobium sp. TaxID=337820 RepID=UPI0025F23A69|nr:hypothetical protein [uncultured Aeromicrobium sp.]